MSEETQERVENGIQRYFFPILMSVLGFILTITTYSISASLSKIEEEMQVIKMEGRDSVKDIQLINYRLQSIESDLKDIKKSQEDSI
jgi:hypothetical protein